MRHESGLGSRSHVNKKREAGVVIGLSRFWKSRCSAGDYFLSLGTLRGRRGMMAYDSKWRERLILTDGLGDKRRERMQDGELHHGLR